MKPTCDGGLQIYLPVWIRQAPTLLEPSLNFWENTSYTWKYELEISSWKIFPMNPRLHYIVILRKVNFPLLQAGLESKVSLKWKIIFREAKK